MVDMFDCRVTKPAVTYLLNTIHIKSVVQRWSVGRTKSVELYGRDGRLWRLLKEIYEEKEEIDLTDPAFEKKMMRVFAEEEDIDIEI